VADQLSSFEQICGRQYLWLRQELGGKSDAQPRRSTARGARRFACAPAGRGERRNWAERRAVRPTAHAGRQGGADGFSLSGPVLAGAACLNCCTRCKARFSSRHPRKAALDTLARVDSEGQWRRERLAELFPNRRTDPRGACVKLSKVADHFPDRVAGWQWDAMTCSLSDLNSGSARKGQEEPQRRGATARSVDGAV